MYLDLSKIKRGNIVIANFGQPVGSEQGGVRPCIVVQNDIGNKFSPCIIVLPITSSETKTHIPTQTEITVEGRWSLAYGEQVRTISKKRIDAGVGIIDHIDDMNCIDTALRVSLAL